LKHLPIFAQSEKVEQLVYVYTNSSNIEKCDDFDYAIEAGADVDGKDYEHMDS
jgi:hypothetical protein